MPVAYPYNVRTHPLRKGLLLGSLRVYEILKYLRFRPLFPIIAKSRVAKIHHAVMIMSPLFMFLRQLVTCRWKCLGLCTINQNNYMESENLPQDSSPLEDIYVLCRLPDFLKRGIWTRTLKTRLIDKHTDILITRHPDTKTCDHPTVKHLGSLIII